MQNKRFIVILLVIACLLLIPVIAMQFTQELKWSLLDFIIMATLLVGSGILIELILRKVKKIQYRIAAFITLLLAFLLIWAELAVGIFGTPFGGS